MSKSFSNVPSVNLLRFGVSTRLPRLNSLSTGALEGRIVLNFRNSLFIFGCLCKHLSFLALPRYSIASDSVLLAD